MEGSGVGVQPLGAGLVFAGEVTSTVGIVFFYVPGFTGIVGFLIGAALLLGASTFGSNTALLGRYVPAIFDISTD